LIRAFIAIEIPAFERLLELMSLLRNSGAKISVPSENSVHITLKFLGEIQESFVERISESLGKIASHLTRFEVEVVGTGAFPNARSPRVLWVGLRDKGELAKIVSELDPAMSSFGIPKEQRPFKPHVTVARVKSMQGLDKALSILREFESVRFGSFIVSELRLKKSTLTPAGAIYEDLAVKPLV
jgi:2'-5' RNA ligase